MSSFPALHDRRDDDDELAATNEADSLGELEHQSSRAQLDPVASLPLELSTDIFTQALPETPDMRASCTLILVCHAWSDIALATPALWNNITDAGIPPAKFADVLRVWLGRGGNYPLSLSILQYMDQASVATTVSALGEHAHRLQTLDMFFVHTEHGITYLGYNPITSDILSHLTLPSLRTLRIPEPNNRDEVLIDFLTRSRPPLRTLQLASTATETMVEIARCVPLSRNSTSRYSSVFQTYSRSTNLDMFPELRSITINATWPHRRPIVYERVLDFLGNRDAVKTLRIIVDDDDTMNERRVCRHRIYDQFRKFQKGGTKIHVGMPDMNFLSTEFSYFEIRRVVEDYRRRLRYH
ncbi:hypothetical protein FB45DRAFT_1065152 [Roridomyces roridus]|uniref:F-box domain-containing protein n=1 Tax=Roridomyces roridus TaxID=1738132 RepID=A0AAD7FD17_9AGAR|nr:hypothetical protein FB45DRAFT_1065152 [Roridomyces roridus]